MGMQETKKRLNDETVSVKLIIQFMRQCSCCQVMSRVHIAVWTHPFEVLAMDHIGPLVADDDGHQYILVLIDSFSRWVELYPTKGVTADETAKCMEDLELLKRS